MSTTISRDFARAFARDLNRMIEEVRSYPDDASVWRTAGTIENGAGTLAVHVSGNLEHFVWNALGGGDWVRDREAEFSERGVARAELAARLERCRDHVIQTLESLDDSRMSEPFPAPLPEPLQGTVHWFLVHLTAHTNWHLGQMDYHRRLVAERAE